MLGETLLPNPVLKVSVFTKILTKITLTAPIDSDCSQGINCIQKNLYVFPSSCCFLPLAHRYDHVYGLFWNKDHRFTVQEVLDFVEEDLKALANS